MIKCLVIDDEPLAIQLLEDYIEKTEFLQLSFSTTSPVEGLQKITSEKFDLILLDIQMPEINGMDFLKILGNRSDVILTTAYSEFALESYDYGVVDYLLKPISYERFYKSVLKIRDKNLLKSTQDPNNVFIKDFFFVKSNGRQNRINYNELFYVEGLRDYINIRAGNDEIIVLENLKTLENILPKNFMRIHKSYIVNLEKISAVEGNQVFVGKKQIPIGDSYKNGLLDWLRSIRIRKSSDEKF